VKRQIHRSKSNEAGFTLLETSIALVILAIAGLGVAACFVYAAKNNTSARDRELAMAVAQQQMEQYRNAAFTDAILNASDTSVTVTRAGRLYRVRTIITDSNAQNGVTRTKQIQVRVFPWSDSAVWARDQQMSPYGSVTIISQRSSHALGPNRTF
jgi:prepilin-type N-terminal cleavage/methylation domain-containing protein